MFLPVTAQMIVSISEVVRQVVSIPEIVRVPKVVRVPKIVSVPEIVRCPRQIISIPELRSDVSLVPNACDSWISATRYWRDRIALRDSCYRVWAGTRDRRSTRINRPPVREGW
jgi:hypothetical protein